MCLDCTARNARSRVTPSVCVMLPRTVPSQATPVPTRFGKSGPSVPALSCASGARPSVPKHHAFAIYTVVSPGTGSGVGSFGVQILFSESARGIENEWSGPNIFVIVCTPLVIEFSPTSYTLSPSSAHQNIWRF